MCTAGTLGEHMCATSEMPVAKNRGSSAAPGIWWRNSGLNSPNTVETFTPTFSNTRPRMMAMTPPPRSSPPGPTSRRHGLRSKRPGGSLRFAPACSSSSRSNSAHRRSRSASNQRRAASLRLVSAASSGNGVGVLVGERIEACSLAQRLAQYHRGGQRDVERARSRLERNTQAEISRRMHLIGHTSAFASDQQRVLGMEGDVWKASLPRGREQHKPPWPARALKSCPRSVSLDSGEIVVVHGGAADALVVDLKAAGFDQVHGHAEAGAEANEGAEILGDVGLVERKTHRLFYP